MNASLQAIADKLAADSRFGGLSANLAADLLNAPDPAITRRTHTGVAEARGLLLARGAWAAIVLASDNPSAPLALRGACITVRDTLSPPMQTVHTGDPATLAVIEACLQGLVDASVLTATVRDELLSLSVVATSWSAANLGEPVSARDVVLARGEA